MTASRWLTASPYTPVFIPYDTALYVLWGALALLAARLGLRRTGSARVAAAIAAALLGAGLAGAWAVAPAAADAGLAVWLACGVLLAIAATALVARARSGGGRRLPASWFALAVASAATVSIVGSGATRPLLVVFPLALAALFALGLPRLPGRARPADRLPAALAVIVVGACATAVYPGSPELVDKPPSTPPDPGPSVILVVLDTLRADHLPVYGYERPLTPNLDRWAEGAAVFRDVTAASSWTLPSHASLFTGLYPRTHGAHGYRPAGRSYPLSLAANTLAELAARRGLATGAIIANHGNLDRRHQLDQGFETYWVGVPREGLRLPPVDRLVRRLHRWHLEEHRWHYYRDRHVTDNVIRWLEAARRRPFFLFVNYMDVHIPSARPPTDEVPKEDELPHSVHDYDFWKVRAAAEPLDPRVRRDLVNSYDRELAHLDGQLGRLFEYLDASGLAQRTSVVLTSDHGEYFGEHDLVLHSLHLHEPVVRVPLLLRGPDVRPGRIDRPVHGVDVFPTVLELLGLEVPAGTQGRSLFADENRPIVTEWYASENPRPLEPDMGGRFDRDLRTYREDGHKLFVDSRGGTELYDLAADPGELDDLSNSRPALREHLRSGLDRWLANHPPAVRRTAPVHETLSEEQKKRLRALGYLD